jgi:hypothetical protein
MERHKSSDDRFEKEWREAFEGAEIMPSAHVWKGIEAEVANQESGYFRRRIFLFKLMAVASVALAMVMSGLWWYASSGNGALMHEPQLLGAETTTRETTLSKAGQGTEAASIQAPEASGLPLQAQTTATASRANGQTSSPNTAPGIGELPQQQRETIARTTRPKFPRNNAPTSPILPKEEEYSPSQFLTSSEKASEAPSGLPMTKVYDEAEALAGLQLPFEYAPSLTQTTRIQGVPLVGLGKRKMKQGADNLWAGINLASGSFDNSIQSYTGFSPAFSTMDAKAQEPEVSSSTGIAYSAGLGMGKRLGKRTVILGGFQYGVMQMTTSSNLYLVNATNMQREALHLHASGGDRSTLSFNTTDVPYEYNNRFEMISLPMQAGYYLVSGKISWMVSAGVASDILLKSVASSADGSIKSEQRPGDNSDWRAFNWSGLVGTALTYKVDERYSLALEPAYRMGLNSLTESTSNYSSVPSSLMLGFRFNYIFP